MNTTGAISLKTGEVEIKIEPNFVLRGNVLPTTEIQASAQAQEIAGGPITGRALSIEEVYAGKICAALDRQLPRDLFDIKYMFETVGFTSSIKDTFLVYLVYQGRPFEEILQPNRLPFTKAGLENLEDLSLRPYALEELSNLREKLITTVSSSFTDKDKEFLSSLMSKKPRFDLAPYPDLERFPGVQWKLLNINKMEPKKRLQAQKNIELLFDRGIGREIELF